jgi:hypothetical protein
MLSSRELNSFPRTRLWRNPDRPRFHLSLREASVHFDVPPDTLATAIRTGALRSKRVNHQSWVAPSAVSAFLGVASDR